MAIVFFCYIRVSQRVWANAASQEKLMDPIKLKKSRSVHLRATIHSCVQIVLVIITLSPHLYEQSLEAFTTSNVSFAQSIFGGSNGPQILQAAAGDSNDAHLPLLQNHQDLSTASAFRESYLLVDGNDADEIGGDESSNSMRTSGGTFAEEDTSSTSSNTVLTGDNHFTRLIGITINYALLILG
jgi:hypothetical protein